MKERIKLLMIDGSTEVHVRLKEALAEEGSVESIRTAHTLLEAMHIMNHSEVNMVTLDTNLPDGNGLDFLRWIKEKYPHVRVIMLSNHANEFYREVAGKLRADYFLDKSIDYEAIRNIIVYSKQ